MKSNLENNIINFNLAIERNSSALKSGRIVIDQLKEKLPVYDSLYYHFQNFTYTYPLQLESSGYSTLKAVSFNLITSDSLRTQLINLYEVNFELLKFNTTENDQSIYNNALVPLITELFHSHQKGEFYIPDDYEALLNNHKYINTVSHFADFVAWSIDLYMQAILDTRELIKQIEIEITKG